MDCSRDDQKQRSAAAPRGAAGAPLGNSERPVVTYTIIGICAVVFAGQLLLGSSITRLLGYAPAVGLAEPWRFVTTAFLHSPQFIPHILFNMYALFIVGPTLERGLGTWRYIALYLISAVGGSVGFLVLSDPLSQSWFTTVVGASGAVFGLFAALFVVQRRLGADARGVLILIGINLAIGFIFTGIAWQAHLGGLLTGGVLSAAYVFFGRRRDSSIEDRDRRSKVVGPLHVAATIGVTVVLIGVTVVKYASVGWL